MNSCLISKHKEQLICEKIKEVPTVLMKQYFEKSNDSITKLVIQLYSENKDPYFENTIYFIKGPFNYQQNGTFDAHGRIELKVEDGLYSVQIKSLGAPNFKMDSLLVKPNLVNCVPIKLGSIGGFQTIKVKK